MRQRDCGSWGEKENSSWKKGIRRGNNLGASIEHWRLSSCLVACSLKGHIDHVSLCNELLYLPHKHLYHPPTHPLSCIDYNVPVSDFVRGPILFLVSASVQDFHLFPLSLSVLFTFCSFGLVLYISQLLRFGCRGLW